MDVLQCPYCKLKFVSESELQQHKAFDHPNVEEAAEDERAEDEASGNSS